jgi:hypothetical protein
VDGSVVVYYRIESIDKDGKTSYTEIKKITFNDPFSTFNLFPNPAKAFVTIECKGMKEIKVINQLGQVIKQLKNPTEHQTINTEQFAKGIYIVQVVTAKNATEIAKFVKQ